MIVRHEPGAFVLISQHDHAALAAAILRHWHADGLPHHPLRERIVNATRVHDIGWVDEDATPRVDVDTGRPHDFMTIPEDLRLAVWPRGIETLEDTPYEAALVAQHALALYRRDEDRPLVKPFLQGMATTRDRLFQSCLDTMPDATLGSFMQAYALLSIADLLSLIVCHGWTRAFDADHYRATLTGDTLHVSPDPFGGQHIPWRIAGRRLDARRFTSDEDLRETYAKAPTVWTEGTLTGVR